MDLAGKSDPYLVFGIHTETINYTRNPIWNEDLEVISGDRNTDVLEIKMLDEDIQMDDKMMDIILIPLCDHQLGEHYVFDNDIKYKKKNAGYLHFELDFLPVE